MVGLPVKMETLPALPIPPVVGELPMSSPGCAYGQIPVAVAVEVADRQGGPELDRRFPRRCRRAVPRTPVH